METLKEWLPLIQVVLLPLLYILHKLDKTVTVLSERLTHFGEKLDDHIEKPKPGGTA